MPQYQANITEIATIGGQVRVRCESLPASRPGQFYLALLDEAALLREPLFPTSATEFVVDPDHHLASREPGDTLDLIGPLGTGWSLAAGASRLLIVAEQPGRMLAAMSAALAHGASVAWSWERGLPGWATTLLPSEVELHTGQLNAEVVEWADVALLDVPDAAGVAARLRALRPLRPAGFVQALCAPLMPCGVGACQACWAATAHGKRLACVDGPIFSI